MRGVLAAALAAASTTTRCVAEVSDLRYVVDSVELDEWNVRVMLLTANEKHARCLEVIQLKWETHVACWLRSEPDKSASLLRLGRGPLKEMWETRSGA